MFFGLLFTSCQNKQENQETEVGAVSEEVLDENKSTVMLYIEGMTCTGCENTITSGLKSIPGVIEATASHVDSNAIVEFDKSRVAIEDMKKMVEKKGYAYISSTPIE